MTYILLEDGEATALTHLARTLEDLLEAVRVRIEPTHDGVLVGFESAGALTG